MVSTLIHLDVHHCIEHFVLRAIEELFALGEVVLAKAHN